jgi:hypothetical protein
MTPEGKVKARLTAGLEQLDAYFFFPVTGGYGRSGLLDLYACIDGWFFAFETKADGNELTELQKKERDKIIAAGGIVFAVIGEAAVELTLMMVEQRIGRKRDRDRGTETKNKRSTTGTRLRADD